MLQAALFIILLLGSQLALSNCAQTVFPTQLQCSASLYLTNKDRNASTDPESIHPVSLYQVEEYVDLDARRSSISIVDAGLDKAKIYYNRVGPDEGSNNSVTFYDPQTSDCKDQLIASWPLAPLRSISINLATSEAKHADVSIGPSGLLYAIESNLTGFVFKSRTFSTLGLTKVDVFSKQIKYDSENVDIIVHLMTRGRDKPERGESLESVSEKVGSLDIALIGGCKTDTFSGGAESQSQGKQTGNNKKDDKDSKQPFGLQLGEDTFCQRDNVIFAIHYHIVSLYRPSALVGKNLDDFGQDNGYNFQLEPFLMPAGIGCSAHDASSRPAWEKSLTQGDLTGKFSAKYVSLYGEPGVSYVAYDYDRRLLRLDQAGRKNIYDLLRPKSYHIGKFALSADEQPIQRDRANNSDASGRDNRNSPQCVVLNLITSNRPILSRVDKDAQVIGLSYDGHERYLGSRMLAGVNYEVFERAWADKSNLPSMLTSAKFPGLESTQNKSLYLTYYAASESDDDAGQSDKPAGQSLPLSFIEVWEFDTVHKKRRLINRVKFLQFSWQLDIEPDGGPQSQRPASNDTRVFDMEPCYQDRATQAELMVRFVKEGPLEINTKWLDEEKDNASLVRRLKYYVSNEIGISILNFVDTKARTFELGDILFTTRVVELRSSLSKAHSLGRLSYKPGDLADYIEKVVPNRHHHEECQLESISVANTSWFAYCPNLAACLILKESERLKSKLVNGKEARELLAQLKREQSSSEDGPKWDACAVESFKYKTVDLGYDFSPEVPALKQTLGFVHLVRRPLYFGRFKFESTHTVQSIAFKQLDSIGLRLTNGVSLLSKLRYCTQEEEPSSLDYNARVTAKTRMGALRFCQLACQIDDFCGSFSVCSSRTSDGMELADCVLSSVRLTADRLNLIMSASAQNERKQTFQVNLKGEFNSQAMTMHRDDSCSLHAQDFLAEYEIDKIWTTDEHNRLEVADQYAEKTEVQKRYLDLDDCAGLSFELGQFTDPAKTNFTYCPLNSHCIVSGDDYDGLIRNTSEYCYMYKRHSTRAYNVQPKIHMVAIKLAPPLSDRPEPAIGEASALPEKLDLLESFAKSGSKQLATMHWGPSVPQCARDCNMHKSKCLAFDACRQDGRVLCILYSRRSPMMEDSADFPLLKQERENLAKYRLELEKSDICDHYYLKDDYFELRLGLMLTGGQESSAVGERQQADKELQKRLDSDNRKARELVLNSFNSYKCVSPQQTRPTCSASVKPDHPSQKLQHKE